MATNITNILEPIIGVAGYPEHGKSTVARIISKLSGCACADTSELIYELLGERTGRNWRNVPKDEARPHLIKLGNEICSDNGPDALVQEAVSRGAKIVAGVRKPFEWQAWKLKSPHSVLIWVERPDFPRKYDNTELTIDDADKIFIIDNLHRAEEKLTLTLWPWLQDLGYWTR